MFWTKEIRTIPGTWEMCYLENNMTVIYRLFQKYFYQQFNKVDSITSG